MRKRSYVLYTLLFTGLVLMAACKKDDTNPVNTNNVNPTPAATYAGTIASARESGSLTLTIASYSNQPAKLTVVVQVTGTLKLDGGGTVSLVGTFDTSTDSLSLSGGGYTFMGKLTGGILGGAYTGPKGPGAFSLQLSANDSVKVLCGTFTSEIDTIHGTFNLVKNNAVLTGLAFSTSNDVIPLNGTAYQDSITIYLPGSTSTVLAKGKFANSADTLASGTYGIADGDYGIWTCSICR